MARLSVLLPTFAAEDPGDWDHLFDVARAADDCLLVDPWNALGTAQVFLYASESAALLGQPAEVDASQELTH